MKIKQENFLVIIENDSPILITIPHGGMRNAYGSWLNTFFNQRTKSDNPEKNIIGQEKIVLGGDGPVMHIVSDILKDYQANVILGLLPRSFVDYNRFIPEVAYADQKIAPFYQAYHNAVSGAIERLKKTWGTIFLFDFHGFGRQPIAGTEFDIILGTNNESAPGGLDKLLYKSLKDKYQIFCAGEDGLPSESALYKGDTTNLYYHNKFDIDAVLVEISPKFRSQPDSKIQGKKLAADLAIFFDTLHRT